MRIRVAYDISFLAKFFARPGQQSGVFRSVEELLFALSERDDVDLTLMGICGDDPLLDAVNSLLYTLNRKGRLRCNFDAAFNSRFGLSKFYLDTFTTAQLLEQDSRAPRAGYIRLMRGLLYRLSYTYKLDKIRRSFNRKRYDVFHSPFLKLPPAALFERAPRVLTIYDLIAIKNPEFMTSDTVALVKELFDSIDIERDWVACISEFTRQEFCDFTGMSPDRVAVTPLGAADHFRPVSDSHATSEALQRHDIPDGPFLLSLAALQPRKNLARLIQSFFMLLSEQPGLDTNLVLVGKASWMFDEIFSAAGSKPALRSRITFTDYVPDSDLGMIYSAATAFVFPSLYEGFGLPCLEAMQCGTPVIASNTTSLPEVMGDAGILVDPIDSTALCQAMLNLITNRGLREELSLKGLERAKEFSWAKCAEKTVELYRKALAFSEAR